MLLLLFSLLFFHHMSSVVSFKGNITGSVFASQLSGVKKKMKTKVEEGSAARGDRELRKKTFPCMFRARFEYVYPSHYIYGHNSIYRFQQPPSMHFDKKTAVGLALLLLQVSSQRSCGFGLIYREISQISNKLLLASIYDILWYLWYCMHNLEIMSTKIVAEMTGIPVQKIDQKVI